MSTDDTRGLWDVVAAPAGGVYVEVSKDVACCSTPLSVEQHSYRRYFRDGDEIASEPAPAADAALYSVPIRLFAHVAYHKGSKPFEGKDILPGLCGATHDSDAAIRVRRSMDVPYTLYTTGRPSGRLISTITTYRSAAEAETFMAELADAVAACPVEPGDPDRRNRIIAGRSFGDRSLLVEVTVGSGTRLTSVFRVGGVVEILYEVGWKSRVADVAFVERTTARAEDELKARLGM